MTIAMSLLIHGEAVRFNRGQSRGDDYDFKYMRGRDGREFPYVSSQCYKKYWRESLPEPFSPISKVKNQAYTDGNPVAFIDDDLFGYMIAGAKESHGDEDAENSEALFDADNLKDAPALRAKLQDSSELSQFILSKSGEKREILEEKDSPESEVQQTLLDALDEAARSDQLSSIKELEAIKDTNKLLKKLNKTKEPKERQQINKEVLLKVFSKELQGKPKRATTRRAAPVRMHALVAFSGIRTAKDFQTFSRYVAYTGENSVVNPSSPGIYSGWLKTRILIESHRIGKFYIGENLDILEDQAKGQTIKAEPNPYSRQKEAVKYMELDETERTNRLRAALRALADIGNRQGPASGALHDGSLRPKAFVAGMMKCADSPFDYVWAGHTDDSMPYLDVNLLRDSIKDWEDLFASNKIYVGLPPQAITSGIKEVLVAELAQIPFGASAHFEVVVDTPRKTLLKLSEEASL